VVRGGSWRTKDRLEMLASYRRPVPPSMRADDIGFRVVLSTDGVKAREEE
jgi:eukaryotic-like serine/threonine-protein kinase